MSEVNEFEEWMLNHFKERIKNQLSFGTHFDYLPITEDSFKLTVTKDKNDHPDSGCYYWNFSFNGYNASVWHLKKYANHSYEWLWSFEIDKAAWSICRRMIINAIKYSNGTSNKPKKKQEEKPEPVECGWETSIIKVNDGGVIRTIQNPFGGIDG